MAEEIITPGEEKEELETPAAVEKEEPGEETSIPVAALQKIRGELQEAKNERQLAQQQLDLYKANMPQGQQTPAPQETSDDGLFGDLDDDDVITVRHMKNVLSKQDAYYQGKVSELQLGTQDKDYSQVISNYLPKALEEDPSIREVIKGSRNPMLAAYKFAQYAKKQADATKPDKGKKVSDNDPISVIDKILGKSQKPISPSAVGGGGSGVSGADVYAGMTDDEVDATFAKLGVQI